MCITKSRTKINLMRCCSPPIPLGEIVTITNCWDHIKRCTFIVAVLHYSKGKVTTSSGPPRDDQTSRRPGKAPTVHHAAALRKMNGAVPHFFRFAKYTRIRTEWRALHECRICKQPKADAECLKMANLMQVSIYCRYRLKQELREFSDSVTK